MTEEIKKEIYDKSYRELNYYQVIKLVDLFEILDKYSQPDYKNAWKELKEYNDALDKTNVNTLFRDNSEFYHYQRGFMMGTKNEIIAIKQLEQKYRI